MCEALGSGVECHLASHFPFICPNSVAWSHLTSRKAGMCGPVPCRGRKERIDFDNLIADSAKHSKELL